MRICFLQRTCFVTTVNGFPIVTMGMVSKYNTVTSDTAPLFGPCKFMPINQGAVGAVNCNSLSKGISVHRLLLNA